MGFSSSSWWVGGTRLLATTRRRVAEAAPSPLWRELLRRVASWNLRVGRADGVDGCAFYSWSSRPLEGRPCEQAAPPPRGGVVFSDACLLGFFNMLAATASTRTVSFACGFRAQAIKKRRAAAARVIRVVSESFRSRQLGAAVASTRARTDHSPAHIAAETAAHTRRKKSARDEGRATQRSNG